MRRGKSRWPTREAGPGVAHVVVRRTSRGTYVASADEPRVTVEAGSAHEALERLQNALRKHGVLQPLDAVRKPPAQKMSGRGEGLRPARPLPSPRGPRKPRGPSPPVERVEEPATPEIRLEAPSDEGAKRALEETATPEIRFDASSDKGAKLT